MEKPLVQIMFWEESQQLLIEKFSQRQYKRARNTSNSITVHIDDGRIGGGGEYFDHYGEYINQASGIISEYYKYNFDDDRKGIFRYLVMVFDAGWDIHRIIKDGMMLWVLVHHQTFC